MCTAERTAGPGPYYAANTRRRDRQHRWPNSPAVLEHSCTQPLIFVFSPIVCVQMQGAAAFVETLDTSSLHVDPDLLLAHMLAAGAITDAEMEMMAKVHG